MHLATLAAAVRDADAEAKRPPPPGGSKPFTFASDHLDEASWKLLWEVVREIRERDAAAFAQFSEVTLVLLVIDALAENSSRDIDHLTAYLTERAGSYRPRIVSTPICHVRMAVSAIKLAEDVVLVRGVADRHGDAGDDAAADLDLAPGGRLGGEGAGFESVRRRLALRIGRPLRHVELSAGPPFDTTRTAALRTIEEGVPPLALARARARAQYAIAMWTVLAPPPVPPPYHLLPDVGIWVPQPSVHVGQRHKEIPELGEPSSSVIEEGSGFRIYEPFVLPPEDELRIPFEAMTNIQQRSAQAVLSASLHLLNAGRASRLQPSERARAVMAAIETLAEHPSPEKSRARPRFLRLMRRHGTDEAAKDRGWTRAGIEEAIERVVKARNIATHGADAVLLDLGYPLGATRAMRFNVALGTELAAGSLQSDLPILVHVVALTLELTIRDLVKDGWSDTAFESYFT